MQSFRILLTPLTYVLVGKASASLLTLIAYITFRLSHL